MGVPCQEGPSVKHMRWICFVIAVSKGNHLWEFLLEKLEDGRYNPTCIKWENRPDGVFRIPNSSRIAQLWGQHKNRPTMNYEKLSRALRLVQFFPPTLTHTHIHIHVQLRGYSSAVGSAQKQTCHEL